MDICFEGVGQVAATFKVDDEEAVQSGMAVALTAGGTVGLGTAADVPCGVMLGSVRGGAAAVQISGVVKVKSSDTAPKVGWQTLGCDGKGGVKTAESGLKCLVLAVDEDDTGKYVIIKL